MISLQINEFCILFYLRNKMSPKNLPTMDITTISKGMDIPEKDIQVMKVVIIPKVYYNSEAWTESTHDAQPSH